MLTFEQIKELIELVSSHRLEGFELERSGFRLKIDGEPATPVAVRSAPATEVPAAPPAVASPVPATVAPPPGPPAAPGQPKSGPAPKATAAELPPDAYIVNSPIVGTFYAAPNPDAKSYVRVGDRVEQGQVLCIIEAMKLMNEIESDVDGVVLEIYPANAQPVEYGEPLFALQPG